MPPSQIKSDIVLIHGMWGCAATLDSMASSLRQAGYVVHQPTLPLHRPNLSREECKELGNYGIQEYASYLKEYLEDLALEQPPILIGHSMGGLLAQHLAAQSPCAKLVLLAPANPAGINCMTPIGLVGTLNALLHSVLRKPVQRPWKWLINLSLLHDFSASDKSRLNKDFLQESTQSYIDIVFWFLQRKRPSAVPLDSIHCPVLILAGAKDRLLRPVVMRGIAKRYPQSILEFLPEHGHMMILPERSQAVQDRILAWLEQKPIVQFNKAKKVSGAGASRSRRSSLSG